MATKQSSKPSSGDLKATLSKFASRINADAPEAKGGIHIHCPDCGEEFGLEGLGRAARVTDRGGAESAIVQVTAPSAVLVEILEGRLDATQAFVRGGIRVRGDLRYLEQVLRNAGMLACE